VKATLLKRLRRMRMTYAQYLASEMWSAAKDRYRRSWLPQECLGCGSARVEYHHRTYMRLGAEMPTDLVPLCRRCHGRVHAYEAEHPSHVKDTHKILRVLFGWTRSQTYEKFRPYQQPGRPLGYSMNPLP
jgi:hypothetical protein